MKARYGLFDGVSLGEGVDEKGDTPDRKRASRYVENKKNGPGKGCTGDEIPEENNLQQHVPVGERNPRKPGCLVLRGNTLRNSK